MNKANDENQTTPVGVGLSELLSCPFCGSINLIIKGENTFFYYILCVDCIANGPINGVKNEAIRLWNLRAR